MYAWTRAFPSYVVTSMSQLAAAAAVTAGEAPKIAAASRWTTSGVTAPARRAAESAFRAWRVSRNSSSEVVSGAAAGGTAGRPTRGVSAAAGSADAASGTIG